MKRYGVLLLVIVWVGLLVGACQPEPEAVVIPTALSLDAISTERAATAQADALTAAALATETPLRLPPTWTPTVPPTDAPTLTPRPPDPAAIIPPTALDEPTGTIFYIYNGTTIGYVSADGTTQSVLPVPQQGERLRDLTASPDRTMMAYVAPSARNNREIYLIDRLGQGQQVTRLGFARVFQPTFRPDGERIAFFASPNPEGPLDIYIVTPDGSGVQQVATTSQAVQNSLTWAANDRNVLFFTDLMLYGVDVISGARYQLTVNDANGAFFSARHHPTENFLLFMREEGRLESGFGGVIVYRLPSDQLAEFPAYQEDARFAGGESLHWASDGSAYLVTQPNGVLVRDWQTSRLATITDTTTITPAATFSPDGQWVAYTDTRPETPDTPQIIIARRDGSGTPRLLTDHPPGTVTTLVWLND